MSAWQAIQKLTDVLGTLPATALPAGHASSIRPTTIADLPAIVITAEDVAERGAGVGGLVRNAPAPGPSSLGSRCSGRLVLELRAAGQPAMKRLSDATFAALAPSKAIADAGFLRLTVRDVGAIEPAPVEATSALLLTVTCAFTHEAVAQDSSDAGAIKTVFVDIQGDPHEVVELGAPLTADERDALIHSPTP